jgi:hypothetical protein
MKNRLLAFARLLRAFQEITTDRGALICDDEIKLNSEVFVLNEEGNLIPAPSGIYKTDITEYQVEGGKVVSISYTEEEKQDVINETVDIVEETVEVLEDEPIVEEVVDEPIVNEEVEALKVENEELKATIEELKKEIEDLKKQLEEPSADAIEEQNTVYSKQEKIKRTSLDALARAFK